jgi:hypothetical protein
VPRVVNSTPRCRHTKSTWSRQGRRKQSECLIANAIDDCHQRARLNPRCNMNKNNQHNKQLNLPGRGSSPAAHRATLQTTSNRRGNRAQLKEMGECVCVLVVCVSKNQHTPDAPAGEKVTTANASNNDRRYHKHSYIYSVVCAANGTVKRNKSPRRCTVRCHRGGAEMFSFFML